MGFSCYFQRMTEFLMIPFYGVHQEEKFIPTDDRVFDDSVLRCSSRRKVQVPYYNISVGERKVPLFFINLQIKEIISYESK